MADDGKKFEGTRFQPVLTSCHGVTVLTQREPDGSLVETHLRFDRELPEGVYLFDPDTMSAKLVKPGEINANEVVELGYSAASPSRHDREYASNIGSEHSAARRIITPPGSLSLRVCDTLLSRDAFEIVEEIVATMQREHFDALQEGRVGKARWIRVRFGWYLIKQLGIDAIFRWLFKLWRSAK